MRTDKRKDAACKQRNNDEEKGESVCRACGLLGIHRSCDEVLCLWNGLVKARVQLSSERDGDEQRDLGFVPFWFSGWLRKF